MKAEYSWEVRENRREPVIAEGNSMELETAKNICEFVMAVEECEYAQIINDGGYIVATYDKEWS